ncbi:MAG: hypothetical protein ACI86M_003799 [Saprospiraceae bacterium]|jgi:hypothetical protein
MTKKKVGHFKLELLFLDVHSRGAKIEDTAHNEYFFCAEG